MVSEDFFESFSVLSSFSSTSPLTLLVICMDSISTGDTLTA